MTSNYFIGIDIGGTKIAGVLATPAGRVMARAKTDTPKNTKPKAIEDAVHLLIAELIQSAGVSRRGLKGIGLGVPGIVDTVNHAILAAPNINLTKYPLYRNMRSKYHVPIAMGNDVNCGLLGEVWLGAARGLKNVVGISPGTGIGGAVVLNGRLMLGVQGAATELGHMIMDVNGPLCHCGNRGCLESLASRWAIERDIRLLLKEGKRSAILRLNKGKLDTIKSRVLKEAITMKDPVVVKVMTGMSKALGAACVSLNHIFNPQAVILGGGIIKACGGFVLPIIEQTVKGDPFFKSFNTCRIIQSTLGDDAVTLGAIRLIEHK